MQQCISTKITPNTMQDEMQKKIFQMLPVIFTFFFLWFPAGLTLYWFINNLFTIGQQYYINRIFESKKELKKKGKPMKKFEANCLEKVYELATADFNCSITELEIEVIQQPSIFLVWKKMLLFRLVLKQL